jgi:hypothetical protein
MGLPEHNDLFGKDAMCQMKYSGASNRDIDYPKCRQEEERWVRAYLSGWYCR